MAEKKRISEMVVEALGLNTLVQAISKLSKRHTKMVEAGQACEEAGLDSAGQEARACALELSDRIKALEALVVDSDSAPKAQRKEATWDSTEDLAQILCLKPRAAAHAAAQHNSIKDLEAVKRAFCQSRNVVRACDKRIAQLEVDVAREWPLPKARVFEMSAGVVYETTGQDAPQVIVDALMSMTAGEAVEQIADITNPKALSLLCAKDERRTVRNAAAKRNAELIHAAQADIKDAMPTKQRKLQATHEAQEAERKAKHAAAERLRRNRIRHERAEGARQAELRAKDARKAAQGPQSVSIPHTAQAKELERKAKHAAAERARRARVKSERKAQAKRTTIKSTTTSKRNLSRARVRSQAA